MSIFPTKVLLATDGSEEGELALRTASDLIEITGSELHVLTVERVEYHAGYDISESGNCPKEAYKSIEREVRQVLDEQIKKVEEAGGVTNAHLGMGRSDREIINLADEIDAGLIVTGSRGCAATTRTWQ